MKVCHVCGSEYEDFVEMCADCGAELHTPEEIAAIEAAEIENTISNPVLAVTCEDVITAEIFRDVLTENGIPFSTPVNSKEIKVLFGGGFASEDIYVDEKDLEKAQQLYDEILNAEPQFEDADFGEFESEE